MTLLAAVAPALETSAHALPALAQGFEERAADVVSAEPLAVVFSVIASVASAVFTVQLVRRYLAGGRSNRALLHWATGLAMFLVASLLLLIGEVAGWNAASFRTYYLFGAVLNVPWLALGSVTINARDRAISRRTGAITFLLLLLIAAVAGFPPIFVPALAFSALWALILRADQDGVRAGSIALLGLFSAVAAFVVASAQLQGVIVPGELPEGRVLFQESVRALSVAGNATGSLLVIVGAAVSAFVMMWRHAPSAERDAARGAARRDPFASAARVTLGGWRGVRAARLDHIVRGNLLIALGVAVAGASGGMFSFLGATAGHAFGFGVGVTVMYRGFLRTSTPRVPAVVAAPAVVVYTRQNCGLCAKAEAIVAVEAGQASVELVDIDADEELQLAYNIRVPVVTVNGVVVAEGLVQPGDVAAAVRAA